MDEVVQKALEQVRSKTRSSFPWNLDEPWHQHWHTYNRADWREAVKAEEQGSISKVALYSWNIDFMLPYPRSRMKIAVGHLRDLVVKDDAERTATVIYLQECVLSDIELLLSHHWIRETFILSDVDISNWQSGHYGTITLIDRRLPVISCFRVHYSETRMERDVLVVDVRIDGNTIRTCNTHLESLALEPPRRPPQMKLCAEYMHSSDVQGAVVAGDFNAIQDFDRTLHSDNSLRDAYLQRGGDEDDVSGHTWGQQAATKLRKQFGTSRMDKVYFCGSLELESFERFGADVMLEDQVEREQIVRLGFDKPWITDHLGVRAVFSISSTK